MTKEDTTSQSTTPLCKPTSGHRILTAAAFLTLLLTLFAFLTALYAINLVQKNNDTVVKLEKEFHNYQNESTDITTSIATLNEAHASLQTQLSTLTQKINIPGHKDNALWAAQQAQYFLELANMEALWENNPAACLALLKEAAKTLSTIQDLSLQPILIEIQQAQQKIANLPKPDLTVLLKLFHQLGEALIKASPQEPAQTEETSPEPSNQAHLQKTLNKFKKLVVIKQHAPSEFSHASLKETLLINRLHLSLQAAKLALLQNNTKLYEIALLQAHRDAEIALEHQPDLKKFTLDTIQQLTQIKLIDSLPSIKAPLEQLQLWIKAHETSSTVPAPQS